MVLTMNTENFSAVRIRQTSVSRPQLQHSDSKQSITASEDHFSLSDHAASESDDHSRITAFKTPTSPPHNLSPQRSNFQSNSSEPAPSLLNPVRETQGSQARSKYSRVVSFDESAIAPKPNPRYILPSDLSRRATMYSASPATTPGMDETPYIRFAIDQLTRDEEVRGSRRYPGPRLQRAESEDSFPVDRRIPSEEPEYMAPRPPPHTLPAHVPARERLSEPALPVQAEGIPVVGDSLVSSAAHEDAGRDVFVPRRPSPDSLTTPPLDFLPYMLRPLGLGMFIAPCLLVLAGLIFSALWSHKHEGLWKYTEFGGSRYFVFEYLPTMIGMFVLLWLFQVQTALQRIGPFIALSSDYARSRSEGVFLNIYPSNFLLPNLQYLSAGFFGLGICSVIFWLFMFTIPLLASCYNVRYFGTAENGEWRWVAVEPVVWATVGLYGLVVLAILVVMLTVSFQETGLKWDPRSLADIICLLERSNVTKDYGGSETFNTKREFRERLLNRSDRIGYWHTTKRQTDVFYSIGEPGGETRRYSIEQGRIKERGAEKPHPKDGSHYSPNHGNFSVRMDIRSSKTRLRYLPWILSDGAVIAWVVIAIVLVLALLIISFVKHAVKNGFSPLVSAVSNNLGFSCSNFLYSFVPTVIGLILFLFWQAVDLNIRTVQPYASLSAPGGATADQSLLVDYTARLPLSITVIAAANDHRRVAFVSLITLVSTTLPILAGGAFWTQFYAGTSSIRVAAHIPGYYALCVFLVIYALSTLVLIPGRSRMALPHRVGNLAEIISFLYQSPITTDRAFSRPTTKADLVTRLMGAGWTDRSTFARSLTNLISPSKRNLGSGDSTPAEKVPAFVSATIFDQNQHNDDGLIYKRMSVADPGSMRYGFGVYYGRDGQEHLGIDRLRRGSGRELVIHESQTRNWISRV